MRLLRPWVTIRLGTFVSDGIGHLAGNTELYLCERDAGINTPRGRVVDLWFYPDLPVANRQLAAMWGRQLRVWPRWILRPADRVSTLLPGGAAHAVGTNTQHDRDVHNLLADTQPHLAFTESEEAQGRAGLRALGVPENASFVCIVGRDSVYRKVITPHLEAAYHDFRDVDIRDFLPAAEALAERGYFVLRMGAAVKEKLQSENPRVIDYAMSGQRSEFLDMYLGAKCTFCISVGTGFDAVPIVFRRPVAYVSMVPVGYLFTFLKQSIFLCKKHWLEAEDRWLSLSEIFSLGVGLCLSSECYSSRGVKLVDNTPEEIRSVAMEMADRLANSWVAEPDDEALQERFRELFPLDVCDAQASRPLHGRCMGRYSAAFLRENRWWLQ